MVLGLLLLAAAGLKAQGLALEPTGEHTILSSPRLEIAAIEAEILLGVWLLSGWAARFAWVAALAFFGILAGVSSYLALVGQQDCGCFGRVAVNPWLTFSIDIAAVAALLVWRPRAGDARDRAVWLGSIVKAIAGAMVILALFGGVVLAVYDSPAEAIVKLRGEKVTVEPAINEIGSGSLGEERVFHLELTNHDIKPIQIVGGTTTCSCITTDQLPVSLAPGASATILVRIRLRGKPGSFEHRFILYTDDENQPWIVARFKGRVVD